MENHGYAVYGGGGFGIISDFSAILIMGTVGAFVRSDCVDRVYLAIIGKVGKCNVDYDSFLLFVIRNDELLRMGSFQFHLSTSMADISHSYVHNLLLKL